MKISICTCLFYVSRLFASLTANELVTIVVDPVVAVDVSPTSASLTIVPTTTNAGSDTLVGSWSIVNNESDTALIEGRLDVPMPGSLTLSATLSGVGTSQGTKALTITDQSLVTGIARNAIDSLSLTLVLGATFDDIPQSFSRTVIYTLSTP